MSRADIPYCLVLVAGVFISSVSQVLLKKSSQKIYSSFVREYINPFVISAYMMFFVATFMSIYAYKAVPLSYGPMLESSGYVFITVLGAVFLKEKVSIKKIISLAVIVTGMIVYSL